MNHCNFSPDRRYRYTLEHRFDGLQLKPCTAMLLPWIGLNPSVADEQALDPTLRRVASFTPHNEWDGFVMLNLFALVATKPAMMKLDQSPVGFSNDALLAMWAKRSGTVVVCWGTHGTHRRRDQWVMDILLKNKVRVLCLGRNGDGSPRHPLYLARNTKFIPYLPDNV